MRASADVRRDDALPTQALCHRVAQRRRTTTRAAPRARARDRDELLVIIS
jgi:hypothetical protein